MTIIQWYPGHMAKTKRILKESLKLIDAVIEMVDARVPLSSRNPEISTLTENKPHILFFNKSDLADVNLTNQWKLWAENLGMHTIIGNCVKGKGVRESLKLAKNTVLESKKLRFNRDIRIMIVGIPNVGKSSFINSVSPGGGRAKTGNKPGVTRGKQWITTDFGVNLMDTPGVLWPKFEDVEVGIKLAITGAIKDDILDLSQLAIKLIDYLKENYRENLSKIADYNETKTSLDFLNEFSKAKGFLIKGGEIDIERGSRYLIDEYRKGKLGQITLEKP